MFHLVTFFCCIFFFSFLHILIIAAMETSQPLSIESFSYSWLVNLKPSLESLDNSLGASLEDACDEASFIEMDPRMPPSKRFIRNSQDKFDFPSSQTPLALVHADELFSNGYVMPLSVDQLKMEAYKSSESPLTLPSASSHASKLVVPPCKRRCSSLRRCRKVSKRIFQKYLDFLWPLYQRICGHRSNSKTETVDTRVHVTNTRVYSTETTPRASGAYSADACCKSCDSESSIYEAVLHCKRSIGK